MVNKDKTGGARQSRLREARIKWLAENAYGLSAEGLIGALMRGECSLSWSSLPTSRSLDWLRRPRNCQVRRNPPTSNANRWASENE